MNEAALGPYCRDVEAHLCRVNGGHLVRIVGPAFDMVRLWHAQGVPLKVVKRGIERRAERAARAPAAGRRPLRIEFCEADVLDVFDEWRRAVGFVLGPAAGADGQHAAGEEGEGPSPGGAPAALRTKAPSLVRHLERAAIRLTSFLATSTAGEPLRARAEAVLAEVEGMRRPPASRGAAREAVIRRLAALDDELLHHLPDEAAEDVLASAKAEALDDLGPYRERLPHAQFARLVDKATRRIARDRLGLPRLSLD
jgi:hypothetical protein